jgi:gliding motility-associated-like protein
MKLRITLFFLFAVVFSVFAQQPATFNSYVTDTGDTVSFFSANHAIIYPPPTPQSCASTNNFVLPYNQNNGQRGIMFDITALSNITINCFDVNLDPGTSGVAIYYKVGTHVGFTTTPGSWTLLGTQNVTGLGNNIPTYVPVPVNVAVTAGCTVAFYITRTTVNGPLVNYTNGTAVGFVFASNADMQVKDGTGKDYPFAASFTPRRFNGTIYYNLSSGPSGGAVTGPLSMCAGSTQTYTFSGSGWTTYTWTVPAGTTITTGQGTNTITILAGSTPGQICCTPSGACGPGPVACLSVTLAPQPTSTTSNVSVSCFGGNNGSATINPSPSGTYTYAWSPSVGNTQTVTGLSAGSYTVTATNSGGCATTQTITITQPTTLTATQSHVDLLCNGANNGSATVNPSGGTPSYVYSWLPSGGNAATASNLSAGTYTCTITDNHGCSTTQSFTITAPAALNLATSSTPSVCGSPNGSASVVASGGAGSYVYSWSPSGGNAATETGLLGGAYVVTVNDGNGCTSTATVNVVGASTPTATITASTDILCNGGNNGAATVTPAGGNGPYSYAWSPSGGNAATENGLTAGTYTITITDADGCSATDSVTITEPPLLTSSLVSTAVLCNGAATGSATVTPAGGNSVYNYSWSPSGGNAATASGLIAQSYTCTVTDGNGCTTTSSVTLTEPSLLTTTSSQVDELCNGTNTGSATVNPAGGAGGYSYAWLPSGGNAATASSLFAGSYTCTITDVNGCSITQSFVITEPLTVVASSGPVTNVDCFGQSTGSIDVTQAGGVGPYAYTWSPNVSSSMNASNIAAGAYQITVTDANGCSSTITITITEPPLLTLQASAAPATICNGQQVALSSTPAGGAPAYNVVWNPGNMMGNVQNVSPSATTTYSATVTDANGCTSNATTTVTVNPVPVAVLTADVVAGCAPVCVNFSDMSTIAAPGIIVAWDWDFGDGNFSTSQNPSHCYATPGVYTIILTAKSADGCTQTVTVTNYISVYVNPIADFTVSPQPTTIFNAQIYFTDASSNASAWSWSFGDVFNSTSILQDPTFTYFAPTCYQVLLTVTSPDGCTDAITHPVCIDPDVSMYVPNAFTPNDDNTNEIFLPIAVGIDPAKYQLWIFDRWGNMIFTTTDLNQGWNGKVQGHDDLCQVDTYVWKVVATDNTGKQYKQVGAVNLIR